MLKNLNFSKNHDFKTKAVLVLLAFCLVLALTFLFHSSALASAEQSPVNAAAGSADDPLLTLSYLNRVFTPQLSRTIDKTIETLTEERLQTVSHRLDRLEDAVSLPAYSGNASSSLSPSNNASGGYVVLELGRGQQLRAKSDSLEIILRPGGTASVISSFMTQGIADLTSGEELLNGDGLPINHSLLIPRADGRGISVTSVIAYVMVRGDYEIF